MSALIITIIGGVVVALVGLSIEYGIIRRKKRDASAPTTPSTAKTTPTLIIDKPHGANELSWPDAINKALDSFQTLHEGQEIQVTSTNVDGYTARLFVVVPGPRIAFNKHYSLTVNRAGDILRIEQSR